MRRSVRIEEYDPEWPKLYDQEKSEILSVIGDNVVGIEHIGSTAIPGVGAKPTIDIMIGIRNLDDAKGCIEPLRSIGYEYVPEYESSIRERGLTGIPERRYFRKGPAGARTHHIHMVEIDSEFWGDHLLFRDYLRANPETAKQYSELKKELAEKYSSHRDAYQKAKSSFIRTVIAKARDSLAESSH